MDSPRFSLPASRWRSIDPTLWSLITIVLLLAIVLTIAAALIMVERRLLALWQDRYGPNRVRP